MPSSPRSIPPFGRRFPRTADVLAARFALIEADAALALAFAAWAKAVAAEPCAASRASLA